MSKIDNRRRNKLARLRRHALVSWAADALHSKIVVGLRVVLSKDDRAFFHVGLVVNDHTVRIHEKDVPKLIEELDALYVQRAHIEGTGTPW